MKRLQAKLLSKKNCNSEGDLGSWCNRRPSAEINYISKQGINRMDVKQTNLELLR